MSDLFGLFLLAVVLGGGLGTIAVWAPRAVATKIAATLMFLAFVPVSYAALVELTSRPKRVDLEWWGRGEKDAVVIANVMVEGKAIYLWLERPGSRVPRAYELPWSKRLAEQLQTATRDAEQQGTEVAMRMPFERSLDPSEQLFYAVPQQPDDGKDQTPSGTAMRYESSAAR